MNKENVSVGRAYPYGAYVFEKGMQFCLACPKDCKVVLRIFNGQGKAIYNINMNDFMIDGSIRSVFIEGLGTEGISYIYLFIHLSMGI